MITGLLALRVNAWNKELDQFHSPYKKEYAWPTDDPWAVAECIKPECMLPDTDDENYIPFPLIQKNCHCGMYASVDKSIVDDYAWKKHTVWFLVEALGQNTYIAQNGVLRAPALLIVGIVNASLDGQGQMIPLKPGYFTLKPKNEAIVRATDMFKVPIHSVETARHMIRIAWERHAKDTETGEALPWNENKFI